MRRMGLVRPEDVLGKSDLQLCPPEAAQQYFADEQKVIKSGQPLIDKEEYVIGAGGECFSVVKKGGGRGYAVYNPARSEGIAQTTASPRGAHRPLRPGRLYRGQHDLALAANAHQGDLRPHRRRSRGCRRPARFRPPRHLNASPEEEAAQQAAKQPKQDSFL